MRRLLGISCALVALVVAPAASPLRAQLLVPTMTPAPVQSLIADKIDPALLELMQTNPHAQLPVISEKQKPLPPLICTPIVISSLEALDPSLPHVILVAATYQCAASRGVARTHHVRGCERCAGDGGPWGGAGSRGG